MSASITCYGSVGEIGGNKLLLEDGEARVLLDFGIAFGRQQMYFSELLRPRAARGLLDPLALGLIPPLEGLYRPDICAPDLWDRFRSHPHYRDLRRGAAPAVDAIFISHAHLDHNGDLSYVDARIPIVSTRESAFIAKAMQVTGLSALEREMVVVSPREQKAGAEFSSARGPCQSRPHHFCDGELSPRAAAFWETSPFSSKAMECGSVSAGTGRIAGLEYRWWPVDHSVPGAAAYAFRTSIGWIGYTGDVRFHGKMGEATRRFARELAALSPVALLCEGTHTDTKAPVTEGEIGMNAGIELSKVAGKLAIVDFGPRNVERLSTFLSLAEASGRQMVLQPKDIFLLDAIHLANETSFPDPASIAALSMYNDPKASPRSWEKELRQSWAEAGKMVSPADVSRRPGDYLLAWSLWDLNDLLDLEGIDGGLYLFSNSKAYDDEQKADLERMRNWVNLMNLRLAGDPEDASAPVFHSSGHAGGDDLTWLVRTVRPGSLIPIHCENPSWWLDKVDPAVTRIMMPRYGQPIEL